MKKNAFTFLFFIFPLFLTSQIKFEPGYFIDNNNQRTECLIKNQEWKNNPTRFGYRLAEGTDSRIAEISGVREFGIYPSSKYIRGYVNIDRSSADISRLTNDPEPQWWEENLFLKVLVDGSGSLYYYDERNLRRYFYSVDGSSPRQLIFKSYRMADNRTAQNEEFRRQLARDLRCEGIPFDELRNLTFTHDNLVNYFIRYNRCVGKDFSNFDRSRNKGKVHLKITPGINFASLSIDNKIENFRDVDFGSRYSFRMGLEFAYVLPFNKNKWALMIEPGFLYYSSSRQTFIQTVEAKYYSLEAPFGVRYHLFFSDHAKIFFNGLVVANADINSKIDYEKTNDLEVTIRPTYALGSGIQYRRLSAEFRYYGSQVILGKYSFWNSSYNKVALILGYQLF